MLVGVPGVSILNETKPREEGVNWTCICPEEGYLL
jgi:hypothetical protein